MKILYDYAAFSRQHRGGVSRCLYELARHVAKNPGIECKIFAGIHQSAYLRDAPKAFKKYIVGWYFPEALFKQTFFLPINRILFQLYAKIYKPDLCHLTYLEQPRLPSSCKTVFTVHDMILEMYWPGCRSAKKKEELVQSCDGTICVSKNTKDDLLKTYNTFGKPVAVIYHGNTLPSICPAPVVADDDYLLYVGGRDQKYKNFDAVLRALAQCDSGLHLVCFGGGALSSGERLRLKELGLSGRVHQLGGSDEMLAGYYHQAKALVYPSKYEGFGLPPIEAMAFGCPVIASSAPPMPEIIGEAGLYFDPVNADRLSECIREICQEPVRRKLIELGKRRAQLFSWEKAAGEAVAVYRNLLKGPLSEE